MVYSIKTKQQVKDNMPVNKEPVYKDDAAATTIETEAKAVPNDAPQGPRVKVRYLERPVSKLDFFPEGKPEDFEFFTSSMQSRVYGKLMQMDKYGIFIGTVQAQNELAKGKQPATIQLFKAADLRDTAKLLIELADIMEHKI